jgi:hypothetical protein
MERNVFQLELNRVRANAEAATKEDLLDRATVYRDGMEPQALEIIDAELRRRGLGAADVAAHAEQRGPVVNDAAGLVRECYRCRRPAVGLGWAWHRLWGRLPLFPRRVAFCERHAPGAAATSPQPDGPRPPE